MDGKKLARDWLSHTDKAFSARTEKVILSHFDKADAIIALVRDHALEDDFDTVIIPQGYKSVRRFAAYYG